MPMTTGASPELPPGVVSICDSGWLSAMLKPGCVRYRQKPAPCEGKSIRGDVWPTFCSKLNGRLPGSIFGAGEEVVGAVKYPEGKIDSCWLNPESESGPRPGLGECVLLLMGGASPLLLEWVCSNEAAL